MSAPNTWDCVPPRRPGTNDFNGIAKIDDQRPGYQPDPQTMPNAKEWNLLGWLGVALGQMLPNVTIDVLGGTSPSVLAVRSPCTTVVIGTITIVRPGAGEVNLTWPAGTFPPQVGQPHAFLNAPDAGQISVIAITNGVIVNMADVHGTSTDYSFSVDIF